MLKNSKTKANQKRKEGNAMEKKRIGIIGGGISGTCLGYHLSLYDNAEVVVFEKDTIGGASTAKSAGTVCLFDDSLTEHGTIMIQIGNHRAQIDYTDSSLTLRWKQKKKALRDLTRPAPW